jgi:hypothetical protein
MDYFLPAGYRSRLDTEPVVEGDEDDLQTDVYADAAALATRLGARSVVGIGCGTARKLAALHPDFEIVGVDTPDTIRRCGERYEFGTWLEADLDNADDLDLDLTRSVLVCENVIERLRAPEKLLSLVAGALDEGAAAAVLSTPHRELVNTPGHLGPPQNPANVREWTSEELERFLASVGLTGHIGLTRTGPSAPFLTTVFVVIPGRAAEYREVAWTWWTERERWQRVVEEQDRTILRQHAWIGQLRTDRDWLASQREAWEATAREKERELVALTDAERGGAFGPGSLRWALRPAQRVAHAVRRIVPRRS